MWRFFTSILLIISPLVANAQLFKDLEEGRSPFVRISFDPTVSLKTYMQEATMTGFATTVDGEIKQNLFLVGGFGMINTNLNNGEYDYNNTGMYITVGADLNLTKYLNPKDRDIFFLGFHYGFSLLSHEATGISISNYWGDYSTSISREEHTASWVELVVGSKAELVKNVFIGWTGKVCFRTHVSDGDMLPYNIPGYGKYDTESRTAFDLNFFISYAFTMKPKKKKTSTSPLEK